MLPNQREYAFYRLNNFVFLYVYLGFSSKFIGTDRLRPLVEILRFIVLASYFGKTNLGFEFFM